MNGNKIPKDRTVNRKHTRRQSGKKNLGYTYISLSNTQLLVPYGVAEMKREMKWVGQGFVWFIRFLFHFHFISFVKFHRLRSADEGTFKKKGIRDKQDAQRKKKTSGKRDTRTKSKRYRKWKKNTFDHWLFSWNFFDRWGRGKNNKQSWSYNTYTNEMRGSESLVRLQTAVGGGRGRQKAATKQRYLYNHSK